jgi:3'(2'), 5'-bisphosphate nucleotidase
MTERQDRRLEALARLTAAIADLASTAGARILKIAAAGAVPRSKPDQSPVTEADEVAEAILTEGLALLLPGVPVVAEEASALQMPELPSGEYLLVDPIDGTRELIAGRGEYTVNVALIQDGAPVLGVVYAPALETLYAGWTVSAVRSRVAPGQRFPHRDVTPLYGRPRPARLVALVSRSHPDPDGHRILAQLPIERQIPVGSSLKFARLAEGVADVYVRGFAIHEWDIAAGHAVLAAAGGRVTATDGGAIVYGRSADFRIGGFVAWGGEPET